jgi:hypothetical protein
MTAVVRSISLEELQDLGMGKILLQPLFHGSQGIDRHKAEHFPPYPGLRKETFFMDVFIKEEITGFFLKLCSMTGRTVSQLKLLSHPLSPERSGLHLLWYQASLIFPRRPKSSGIDSFV